MQNLLTREELDHLSDVIAEAELKTSGEIRLMIVRRSSRTSHVFPLLAAIGAALVLIGIWFERSTVLLSGRDWVMPLSLWIAGIVALGLARFQTVQRRLTSASDLDHQVRMRAEIEFHREGLSATVDGTGILIFLSMMERQAVVLADKGIASKVGADIWKDVVGLVLEGARSKRLAVKLEEAVRKCGSLLAVNFPIKPGDKNELSNTVIVKD